MAIEKSQCAAEFPAFEEVGWSASIAGYDDAFGAVTRKTVEKTLDAASVEAGMHVRDVCCGPDMLAEGASTRGASAVGLDFSSVVELARKTVPKGEFKQVMR